jgi:hypothetical protein
MDHTAPKILNSFHSLVEKIKVLTNVNYSKEYLQMTA